MADKQARLIANALKHHDAAALRKVFSAHARDSVDLDPGLNYFLSVFPSGWTSWSVVGPNSQTNTGDYKEITLISAAYEVHANGKKYNVSLFDVSQDDFHADTVGIWALGAGPWSPAPGSPKGKTTPYAIWGSQFGLGDTGPTGDPGIYIPPN